MKTVSAIFFLYTSAVWGLSGGNSLSKAIEEAKRTDAREAQYLTRIQDASAYVRLIDGDPIKESVHPQLGRVLEFTEFEQVGCGAIHFKEPAYFATSATCFADAEGGLDLNRRYAKVFVKGQGYTVDPTSIVIHPEFNKGAGGNDIAVFTLEPEQITSFDRSHTPIAIIPSDSWTLEGQVSWFAGAGQTTEQGKDFGDMRFKTFVQKYPDPEDQAQAGEALQLSASEKLFTFVAQHGKKGIVCTGDSGGGAFTVLSAGPEQEDVFAQAIIVGKVGPRGNGDVACESTDRYAAAIDLRYYQQWLDSTPKTVEAQITDAKKRATEHGQLTKKMYNSNLFGLYLPVPLADIERKIDALSAGLTTNERNMKLNLYMQFEAKRRAAREFLASSSLSRPAPARVITKLEVPVDPWATPEGWIVLNRQTDRSNQNEFNYNIPPYIGTSRAIRVRNIGDQPVEVGSLTASTAIGYLSAENKTLQPGQTIDLPFIDKARNRYTIGEVYSLSLQARGAKHLRAEVQEATKHELAQREAQRAYDQRVAEANRRQQLARQEVIDYNRFNDVYNAGVNELKRESAAARALYANGQWSVYDWNAWVERHNRASDNLLYNQNRNTAEHNRKYGTNYNENLRSQTESSPVQSSGRIYIQIPVIIGY